MSKYNVVPPIRPSGSSIISPVIQPPGSPIVIQPPRSPIVNPLIQPIVIQPPRSPIVNPPIQPSVIQPPRSPIVYPVIQPSVIQPPRSPIVNPLIQPSLIQPPRSPSLIQPPGSPSVIQPPRLPSLIQPPGSPIVIQSSRSPSVIQPARSPIVNPLIQPSVIQPAGSPIVIQPPRSPIVIQPSRSPIVIQPSKSLVVVQPPRPVVDIVPQDTIKQQIVSAQSITQNVIETFDENVLKHVKLDPISIGSILVPIQSEPKIEPISLVLKDKVREELEEKKRKELLSSGKYDITESNKNKLEQEATDRNKLFSEDLTLDFEIPKFEHKLVYDIETDNGFVQYFRYENKDMLYWQGSPKLDYKSGRTDFKASVGWGQRKLGIGLIQFLTIYWDSRKVPNPIVLYAGAAPGKNIQMAIYLFPEFEWHLYDPHPIIIDKAAIIAAKLGKVPEKDKDRLRKKFESDLDEKVKIFTGDEGWFNENTAKIYSERYAGRIFFVSDIRSVKSPDDESVSGVVTSSDEEFERGVWQDMQNQSNWHKILNPVKSQLKFRLPYPMVEFEDQSVHYLNGTVYKQPYTKINSTETRLVPDDSSETYWNFKEYESIMSYHNVVIREQFKYLNPYHIPGTPESFGSVLPPELLSDYDSATEVHVWNLYMIKRGITPSADKIKSLSERLTEFILSGIPQEKRKSLSSRRGVK